LRRTLAVALCVACTASGAEAQDARVEFVWSAPDNCPETGEVRMWVERLLGSPLDSFADRVRSVRGEIKPTAGRRLRLRIVTTGSNGTRERTLDSREDCQILAATAVVIIALSVDESLPERLAAPEDAARAMAGVPVAPPSGIAPVEGTPPPVATPASPPAERAPREDVPAWTPPPEGLVRPDPPEKARPWNPTISYSAGLAAGVAVGQTPGAGFGVGGTGGVSLDWLRFEAGAAVWPATGAPVEGGGAVEVWLWNAHLAAGVAPAVAEHVQARLLAGAEVGRLRADPVGLEDPEGVGDGWTALRLAPGIVYAPGGMVSFGLLLHAVVPFQRPRYRVPPQGLIFRADPLVVRLNFGLELTFE
jgi:hypothetical protein